MGSEVANQGAIATESPYRWGMVIDMDICTACGACEVACQAENNIPLNTEDRFLQQRAISWIRTERYWEGDFPEVQAVNMPVPCQHCGNAPCEPVCPVYAPYHTPEGLNAQIYNRCIGTRLCANACPYNVRFFNFWPTSWPDSLRNQLNPDVTVRSQGIMEKCTFCVQRINRAERTAAGQGRTVRDGELQPACAQACPSSALVFGNLKDANSRVSKMQSDPRAFRLLEELGTEPAVTYLKKVKE
jgi:Fe-S-cluster-containing dehydrogenase component